MKLVRQRVTNQLISQMLSHRPPRQPGPYPHYSFMLPSSSSQVKVKRVDVAREDEHAFRLLHVDDNEYIGKSVREHMKQIEAGGRLVVYHIFRYRQYECWALLLLSLQKKWVGVVRVPSSRPLVWPTERAFGKRPFGVGIDFDLSYDDSSHIVGFHTNHLQDLSSFDGVHTAHRSVDYVVDQLRSYIDMCLETPPSSTRKRRNQASKQ